MGAKLGGGSGFDDINMTPLIDIVLVVLIIMMVSIPISVNELGVKLPPNPPPPPPENPEEIEQLVIGIYEDGRIALNRKVLVKDSTEIFESRDSAVKERLLFPLTQEVGRRLRSARKKNVFIDAHPDVPYGLVIDLMDLSREGGAVNVGLAKYKLDGPLSATSVGSGVMPRGVLLSSPRVTVGEKGGAINEKMADAAFQRLMPTIRGCYDQALAGSRLLTGRIVVQVNVGPEGELMSGTEIRASSMDHDALEQCVTDIIPSIAFEPQGPEKVTAIMYTILFSPG
ncbi:MAG: biopolymer transport protein ExbD [Kiritimatiellia bacterium]|jgi:biopolymer transport protein ExbD